MAGGLGAVLRLLVVVVAAVSARPPVFLAAGLAVFVVTALLPLGDPRLPPAPVAGQRFWQLPSGSRVAWVHLPARGRPQPTPVVFLHGGTGRSSRLADPRGYTIARQVADLEAIRERIGAARLVLIGHSWGGQVAAAYLAAHPANVARVVFSSPGALAPALDDGSGGGVRGRLPRARQLRLYALLVRPRVLLGYGLPQLNPRAAHAFVGDAEMDARNDRVYNAGRAGTHCRGLGPGPARHGLGFYSYQFPQSAAARPWADPRPGLAYRHALANARLLYLDHAGHNAYQDQPAAYLAAVRSFLAGRPR